MPKAQNNCGTDSSRINKDHDIWFADKHVYKMCIQLLPSWWTMSLFSQTNEEQDERQ